MRIFLFYGKARFSALVIATTVTGLIAIAVGTKGFKITVDFAFTNI